MSTRYYIHNLETDKVNVFTGGKSEWLAMPEADRDEIKRCCLWSRTINGWVSRGKNGSWNVQHLCETLKRLGWEYRGTEGEKLSFAEQIEVKQERAAERAERMETRSDAAEDRSEAAYKRSHDMMDAIPMGQPILVGHHSEQRDRNYRERAWNLMGKAVAESDKAKYYAGRAATARATAEGEQYSNPRYLGNRIKECKAEIGTIERRLQGKYFATVQAERMNAASGAEVPPDFEVSEAYRERLNGLLAEQQDKLAFFEHCLETCGATIYNRETLKGMQMVKIRGRWEPIVRLNPTTVAVPNICFQTEESQRKWAMKYPYTEVQEAR